jgi:hypothetical protein
LTTRGSKSSGHGKRFKIESRNEARPFIHVPKMSGHEAPFQVPKKLLC